LTPWAGAGRLRYVDAPGAYARAQLVGVASRVDSDVTFAYRWAQTGGAGTYFNVTLRGSGGWMNGYRPRSGYYLNIAASSGTVTMEKSVNGTVTKLHSGSGAQQVGTGKQHVRFRVSGSTLQFRTWADGTPEPATWAATVTDTSIASGGQLFLALARGSTNVGPKDLTVGDLTLSAT